MTDSLRDKLRALAARWDELRATEPRVAAAELRACAQELTAILDAEGQDETAEFSSGVCAHDVGDVGACRCWLPRGHSGLHVCECEQHAAPSVSPGEPEDCRCGWGGTHDPDNPRCPANAPEGQPEGSERCGARHPVNETAVPCVEDAGHAGMHVSSTGCAGSRIEWACEHCGAIMHTSDRCALRPRPAAPAPVPDDEAAELVAKTLYDTASEPSGVKARAILAALRSVGYVSPTAAGSSPVPDDEAVRRLAQVILAERLTARALPDRYVSDRELIDAMEPRARAILAAGYVSPEAHAAAVRDLRKQVAILSEQVGAYAADSAKWRVWRDEDARRLKEARESKDAAVREAVQAHGERIAEAIEADRAEGYWIAHMYYAQGRSDAARIARDLTREAIR